MSTETYTIVIVCKGNIARSPFAEAIVKRELVARKLDGEFCVASRGMQGTKIDPALPKHANITQYRQIYRDSRATLMKFGIDLSKHQSASITEDIAAEASIILAMDQQTKTALQVLFPKMIHKMHLLAELANQRHDIHDPEKATGPKAQEHIFTAIHALLTENFDALLTMARETAKPKGLIDEE